MISTVYRHYGSSKFDPSLMTCVLQNRLMKPVGGLWASPSDSPVSWFNWCHNEQWGVESLNEYFDFTLKPDAQIFHVNSFEDLKQLICKYPGDEMHKFECSVYQPPRCKEYLSHYPDFLLMSKDYGGVEISISSDPSLYYWMYGWDVDSIVVWNSEIIQLI